MRPTRIAIADQYDSKNSYASSFIYDNVANSKISALITPNAEPVTGDSNYYTIAINNTINLPLSLAVHTGSPTQATALGREDTSEYTKNYSYYGTGQIDTEKNGILSTKKTYQARNLLDSVTVTDVASGDIHSTTYTYDLLGNASLSSATQVIGGKTLTADSQTNT